MVRVMVYYGTKPFFLESNTVEYQFTETNNPALSSDTGTEKENARRRKTDNRIFREEVFNSCYC